MSGNLGIEAVDKEPYIFFSYNTEDQEKIGEIALELHDKQLNIWYDKGISRTSDEEWQEQIANHIRNAGIICFFISNGIFLKEDSFVKKEFELSKKQQQKICIVMMDKINPKEIPPKYDFWWVEIENTQCIQAVGLSPKEIAKEIYEECKINGLVSNENKYDAIYCYRNSNVLKNKLNIINEDDLLEYEKKIVTPIYNKLKVEPSKKNYGVADYLALHKKLYDQFFDWAGEIRKVNISDSINYCFCEHILQKLNEVLMDINDEKFVNASTDEKYGRLAFYLGELNAIHPFRYGNQVTQELFITILAKKWNCKIDFEKVNREEMNNAYKRSFFGDYTLLERELKKG